MARDGIPFRGVLYTGLMITSEGPKVVEFNARLGDPETQVILPLLETDLLDIFLATVSGELSAIDVTWKQGNAVCVVMAAPGYPGDYPKGAPIAGLDRLEENTLVFHAGTQRTGEAVVTSGGRVLGVTGVGDSIVAAREAAYSAVSKISFDGAHYRSDIAKKALDRA
jgi:phosphoribosylamine--glycine ligase